MPIKVVELFAGVGGFRIGLNQASNDFDFVWANQWEPNKLKQHAFQCYSTHFGLSDNHVNEDIAKAKHLVPPHDLLVGGFPCQDYSVASTGAKGIQGKKGVLWWEIRDIIELRNPHFVLLENVDRLIKSPSKQRGRDFGIMLKTLYDLNYDVEWKIVNASDYGNAQRRRRVFIFAYKNNLEDFKYSKINTDNFTVEKNGLLFDAFPSELDNKKKSHAINISQYSDLVKMTDSFSFTFHNTGIMKNGFIYTANTLPKNEPYRPLKDILQSNVDEKYNISNDLSKWKYLKGSKKIQRVKPNGEGYLYSEGALSFPDDIELPSRTILTAESSLNRSTHVISDPQSKKLRLLTEIECERLNGFPDDWTNTGMPSKFRYFVMGNALVVPLITRIGKQLLLALKNTV
jgi:DNA (cytosine-5)-methyltransferase 1